MLSSICNAVSRSLGYGQHAISALCAGGENGSRSLATVQIGVMCVRATRGPALLTSARLVAPDHPGGQLFHELGRGP